MLPPTFVTLPMPEGILPAFAGILLAEDERFPLFELLILPFPVAIFTS
jgi:hypothetical protein